MPCVAPQCYIPQARRMAAYARVERNAGGDPNLDIFMVLGISRFLTILRRLGPGRTARRKAGEGPHQP
jgi:hypothetical protein